MPDDRTQQPNETSTRALLNQVRVSLAEGDTRQAAGQLRHALAPDMDFTSATLAARLLARIRRVARPGAGPVRVAVLGSTTTSQLTSFLDLFLFARNIDAEIYEAPYGVFRQEILDPSSGLNRFAPHLVFLATTRRDLGRLPGSADTPESVEAAVDVEVSDWLLLWETIRTRLDCQVIQNNFDAPPWRTFGSFEMGHAAAPGNFIDRINRELRRRAPRGVTLHDLDGLAASIGRWTWGDDRFFHLAKLPCAPEHLVPYAHSVAALVAAHLGRSHKCLVLDLDNTLWGGVIGDDGLAGITIGQGDAVGEAYVAFQRYAKALRERGVILAVCSKNEEDNAREPFEKLPEMVLKLDDFSCFVANWQDKAANLRSIAEQLNIGLDALVFVDDNPAERSLVRRLLPDVAVPEMPADPADYIRAVEQHRYFEVLSLSREDFQRTEYYRANTQRQQAVSSGADLDAFLRSLDMRGWIGPISELDLDRSVQLIGKSNQFNLTTRRHSSTDIQRMIAGREWVTCIVKLADRFGDNGLISVLLAREDGKTLDIDTWLMSCRVLKRGVEQFLLNHVVEIARKRGLSRLTGEYIPTAKNTLVEHHYRDLGFVCVQNDASGRTRWQLELGDGWTPRSHHVREERS
jgi:FkbH-like protein